MLIDLGLFISMNIIFPDPFNSFYVPLLFLIIWRIHKRTVKKQTHIDNSKMV